MLDQESLTGSMVAGKYPVGELIGRGPRSAVYRTRGEGGRPAALKLTPADAPAADIAAVNHPHILKLSATGVSEVNGTPYRYYVSEAADENLATVVAERPLTPDETREMLHPVLDALTYLHEHGLVHANLKPSNILAAGDSIKLSADSIRPAGAMASEAEDMRALGLTIIDVLTQERQPSAMIKIPQPFQDIVAHALAMEGKGRWSAAQAAMRLTGAMPVEAAAVSRQPSALSHEAPPRNGVGPAFPSTGTAATRQRARIPIWVFPAAAGGVIVVALVLARGTGSPAVTKAPVVTTPPPRVVQEQPKPTPFEAPPKPAPAAPAAEPHGWFVVTASYARQADAEHKARSLARQFPQFKPSVFPPSKIDTHYLVILGSGLSQASAENLRQRAVASGLPGDTYIKMYPATRR